MFHSNNQQANGLENGSGLQIESPIHSYCESFFTPVVQFKALVKLKKREASLFSRKNNREAYHCWVLLRIAGWKSAINDTLVSGSGSITPAPHSGGEDRESSRRMNLILSAASCRDCCAFSDEYIDTQWTMDSNLFNISLLTGTTVYF